MDWANVRPATTLSVPDRLSIDLERLILDGELKPGERLPAERELAEHLGVSRVSIRQALRELETRGLIDRRPGRGTIVLAPGEAAGYAPAKPPGADSGASALHDIMELRVILEPPIARLTAKRATPRDIEQLRELVEAMETEVSKERYAELDRAFHQAIAQYSHNPLLVSLNEKIAEHVAPSRARRYQTKARRTASTAAHRRIFEAIAAGDGDIAEAEAKAHVIAVASEIVQTSSRASRPGKGKTS